MNIFDIPAFTDNYIWAIQIEEAKLVIDPGDLIIGDEDGLTRIPLDIAEDTLIKCKEVREKEAKLMSKEGLKEKFDLY